MEIEHLENESKCIWGNSGLHSRRGKNEEQENEEEDGEGM